MATVTDELIKRLVKEQELYRTYELNEILYLHFKGLIGISKLDRWTGLRALWLEGNAITTIENISHLKNLRCLYLHQNLIEEISGLEGLDELDQLNLADNSISRLQGLSSLRKLNSLYLANNKLSTVEDMIHLLECPSIACLDVSRNKIDDPAVVDEVFARMPNLKVLKLDGNPVVRKIASYRKSILSKLPQLTYLDDRPVFDDERRCVTAWARGGIEAERAERDLIRDEQIQKDKANMRALEEIAEQGRQRRAEREAQEEAERNAENDNDLRVYAVPNESSTTRSVATLLTSFGDDDQEEPVDEAQPSIVGDSVSDNEEDNHVADQTFITASAPEDIQDEPVAEEASHQEVVDDGPSKTHKELPIPNMKFGSPTIWGTRKYDELWEAASKLQPAEEAPDAGAIVDEEDVVLDATSASSGTELEAMD